MQLVPDVAAILLAFAAHAVDDRFLRAIDHRVDGGIHDLLHARVGNADLRLFGPGQEAPAHTDLPDADGPAVIAHMQLNPPQAFEVERLEDVLPFRADEARPRMEMRIHDRRPVGVVRFMHEQLDDRPRRRVDHEFRPPDDLLGKLERQQSGVTALDRKGRRLALV